MAHPDLLQFISSNEQPQPIHFKPTQTVNELLKQSLLPYLPIVGIAVPFQQMLIEAKQVSELAVAHRSYDEENRGWKSLCIHGISAQQTQGAEHYGLDPMDQSVHRWTEIANACPVTKEFLQFTLGYTAFFRVRFMYLEPGGYILPHRDVEHYYLGPLNIALNHPPGCRFIMENIGEVPFSPGQINKMALQYRHAVVNNSSETRIHLIVHGHADPKRWDTIVNNSHRSLMHGPFAARYIEC